MRTLVIDHGKFTGAAARCIAYGVCATLFAACGSGAPPADSKSTDSQVSPITTHVGDTVLANTIDTDTSAYATAYILIADTGQDYYILHNVMQSIADAQHWPVDTMGRYYNKKKKEIVLPDDDEDEIYRGEYFPRRYASTNLSLEYYRSYANTSTTKNIALVADISSDEQHADSLLNRIRPLAPKAFVHKTKLYMGCMH